jgi:hypothetical protein
VFGPAYQARASTSITASRAGECLEGLTGVLRCQDGKQYNQIRLSKCYYHSVHGSPGGMLRQLAGMELTKGFEPPTL